MTIGRNKISAAFPDGRERISNRRKRNGPLVPALYCRDYDRQAEDELYILRRAGDLAPFEKKRRRLILEEGGR